MKVHLIFIICVKAGNSHISRDASQLSQNKTTITQTKMVRPSKITPEVYQTIEEKNFKRI